MPAVPPETWATGYLQGDGVLDALASAALAGIDAAGQVWSRIVLVEAPPTDSYIAGSTTSGGTQVERLRYNPATVMSAATLVSSWHYASAVPPSGSPKAAVGIYDRVANTVTGLVVTAGGSGTSGAVDAGAESVYAHHAYVGSFAGTLPFTGRIWGDVVLLAAPTVGELQQYVAGVPPWVIWTPALVARAWCPALAASDKGAVTIPDVALAHGGVYAPVGGTLRSGDLADIVIP